MSHTLYALAPSATTGLIPTLYLYNDTDSSVAVSDLAMTEIARGLYKYVFTDYNYRKKYIGVIDFGNTFAAATRYQVIGNECFTPAEIKEEIGNVGGGGGVMIDYKKIAADSAKAVLRSSVGSGTVAEVLNSIGGDLNVSDLAEYVQKAMENALGSIHRAVESNGEEVIAEIKNKPVMEFDYDKIFKNQEKVKEELCEEMKEYSEYICTDISKSKEELSGEIGKVPEEIMMKLSEKDEREREELELKALRKLALQKLNG